jgi:hypothetical protein
MKAITMPPRSRLRRETPQRQRLVARTSCRSGSQPRRVMGEQTA